MIDLHLHTTASDGILTPDVLVERAAAAGIRVLAVTDHDTVAGLPAARTAAARHGVRLVEGIEITAIEDGVDVHLLGYFFDSGNATLNELLETQRGHRLRRVQAIGDRLRELGADVDVAAILQRGASSGRTVGRPAIADALVAAGHAASRDDAFARLLGRGCPAFVERAGATCAQVVEAIHRAGGVASLAHPGVLRRDDMIPSLVGAGLDAIEVWHSDHSSGDRDRYQALSDELGVVRSGGSDFHGEGMHRAAALGGIDLPAEEFARLESRAARLAGTSRT